MRKIFSTAMVLLIVLLTFPMFVQKAKADSDFTFGTPIGSYNGVTAYSNYEWNYVSNEYNYVDDYNTGMKWQCVEYVNRYYYIIYGMKIRIPGTNANQYYNTAADRGLIAYPNGGTMSPRPGDILCSNGGEYGPGHVAIVREVTDDSVHVIHQNWANTAADNDKTISISVSSGNYTVSGFSDSYPVQGWLRPIVLYAGGSDPGVVYKYAGGTEWEVISPELGYAVLCLVEYNGRLHAGTTSEYGMYSGIGKVWRYDGGTTWTLVGDNLDHDVCSLVVYRGDLYAGTSANGMRLYRYDGGATWTRVVDAGWDGTRSLYAYGDYLLMGDIYWDYIGLWDGSTFQRVQPTREGSCIYDFEEYGGYVYAAAYDGRLWRSPNGFSWSVMLGYYDGNMWEVEEFKGKLYMSYNNGELRAYDGTGSLRGESVYRAPDGIISMTTDQDYLYFGTGGDAVGYGPESSGIASVYRYDGTNVVLISSEDEMVTGVQVLYTPVAPVFNIAVVFTKFSVDDPAPSRSITDFKNIENDLISYYSEVSYGSISFGIKFYPSDGSWLRLPHDRKYYGENTKYYWWIGDLNKLFPDKNAEQFVKDAINVSDGIVDFTRYDYDANNGRGIVMFIHPGYSEQHCKSTDDLKTAASIALGTSGYYDTNDNTKIDGIILAEMDNVGAWAHEVGHILGKLLVTSVSGQCKDCAWALPDRYNGGYMAGDGDIDYWGIMGRGSWLPGGTATHPDHMCSYSKEWLGWLKYHEYQHPSYGTYWINSLVTMKYGDDVFKYKINDNMYYILEVRNKNSRYSNWDTTAPTPWLHDSTEVIYKVEKKNDVWIVNVQASIVLSPVPIIQSDYYSDDANKVMFEVVGETWGTTIYEMKTEIKEPTIWNKLGAVLNPWAQLISSIPKVIYGTPFQFEYPLPDLDLHAYSSDGKHVGMNYLTGEYEMEIPEATASGDLWNGQEWIFVPEDANVYFVVSAKENLEFLSSFPKASAFTDGRETYTLSIVYYDSNGLRYESTLLTQQILPGDTLTHPYSIIQNPDGTYSIMVSEGQSLTTVTTWMTDSDFNSITSFRAVFTPQGKTGYYKLTATNPGQFYQNILVNNTGPIPLNITITYDIDANFTLKGAKPIHVYADLSRTIDITSNCTFQDNKITAYKVPPSGIIYVTIHLDYALKRTTWTKSQVETWYSEHTFNATAETDISSIKFNVTITDPETTIPPIPTYSVFLVAIPPTIVIGLITVSLKYGPLTLKRRKEK